MVLAYSRMMYAEFTRTEKFEDFIRCHENAFRYFGGVPKECWYDNLRTAVTDRMGSLIKFNARFMAYMGHHGIRPHACNVARGNEKGRVEDAIKYIRMNFWSGRQFNDFEDLNSQFMIWRNQIANNREHRSTRRVVRLLFTNEEKAKLLTPNETPYDTDEVFSRSVPPDFHFQYESNRYSVPWTLVGMTVTVRVTPDTVKIYYREKFICFHYRSYKKAKVFTDNAHKEGLLKRKPGGARESWRLEYVKKLDPLMSEYIELVKLGQRSLRHELNKIIGLTIIYGKEAIVEACDECLKSGIVGVDNLELHLRRKHHPADTELGPAPIKFEKEKLNRVHPTVDLRSYDALLFEGKNQGSAEGGRNDDKHTEPERGAHRAETEILGTTNDSGSREHEKGGAGHHCPASLEMDQN